MSLKTIAATAMVAFTGLTASAPAEELDVTRCVGNGALDVKYCVDTEGSCLLASYSSVAGSRCYIRNP